MIDNEQEVFALIEALNQHLPMRAYSTPSLVQAVRQNGGEIKVNEPVKIESVLYLGDVGGVMCALKRKEARTGW